MSEICYRETKDCVISREEFVMNFATVYLAMWAAQQELDKPVASWEPNKVVLDNIVMKAPTERAYTIARLMYDRMAELSDWL